MTKDEALKLALDALENISTALREDDVLGSDIELMLNTITTIREALAQPEPDLTIVYQSGYYDGKKAALAKRKWNFCERCGKRTADLTTIHTCTPPRENS